MNKKQFERNILTVVFIGAFLATLGTSIINIAIPVLMDEFGTNVDQIKWTMSGFMLAMGTIAPITGYLGEKIGYRKLYIFSLIGLGGVSLLIIQSNDIYALVTFRVLQGIVCGIIAPSSIALVYQLIDKERQPFAISIFSLASMLAPAMGPALGGGLIDLFGWRSIFIINIPLSILAVLLSYKFLPNNRIKVNSSKINITSLFCSVIGTISLLIGFSYISQWGIVSEKFIVTIIMGSIFLILFFYKESNSSNPMLNVRVFHNRTFAISIFISCIITVALYAGALLTPIFLQNVQGMSALEAGRVLLPSSLVMALAMPVIGKLYGRIKTFKLVLAGLSLIIVGSIKLSGLAVDTAESYVMMWMVVRSIGIALSTMPVMNIGMMALPIELTGHASAINNWARQIMGSLSLGVFGSIMTSKTLEYTQQIEGSYLENQFDLISQATVLSINDIYLLSALIVIIGIPFVFLLKNEKCN
ncbi:MAG TPA: MFS transporter [Eubacteriaceae bacterium]|nr:MFS transporter [Eubacteriaceae bacterium]